jgi:hypothetical protein
VSANVNTVPDADRSAHTMLVSYAHAPVAWKWPVKLYDPSENTLSVAHPSTATSNLIVASYTMFVSLICPS